jgi:hypothetical protein
VTALAAVSPLADDDSPPEDVPLADGDPPASPVPLELLDPLEDDSPELVVDALASGLAEEDVVEVSRARLVSDVLLAAPDVLALLVLERELALRLPAALDFFALAPAPVPALAVLAARRFSAATSAGSWPDASCT